MVNVEITIQNEGIIWWILQPWFLLGWLHDGSAGLQENLEALWFYGPFSVPFRPLGGTFWHLIMPTAIILSPFKLWRRNCSPDCDRLNGGSRTWISPLRCPSSVALTRLLMTWFPCTVDIMIFIGNKDTYIRHFSLKSQWPHNWYRL